MSLKYNLLHCIWIIWRRFLQKSLKLDSLAFSKNEMKEPFKWVMSTPAPPEKPPSPTPSTPPSTPPPLSHVPALSPLTMTCLFLGLLIYVNRCWLIMKDPRRKVSQEVIINYHYYFWQLANNIFPPNLTGLTFTCQNWHTGTGERKNVHKPPPEDATVATIT